MSVNIESGRPRDHSRIDLNDEAELRYWCEFFNCRADELRVAVNAVGASPTDVKIYLGK